MGASSLLLNCVWLTLNRWRRKKAGGLESKAFQWDEYQALKNNSKIDDDGGIVCEDKGLTAAAGLVHPLIRSASTDREAYAALLSCINAHLNFHSTLP
jgi:hypothetical protein